MSDYPTFFNVALPMKKPEKQKSEFQPDSVGILAEIAELYYKDGLTQNEIAVRIGVSRPTVVNYIKQAREQGIVDIQIRGSTYKGSNLSRELCEKYGLSDVYIVRASTEIDDDAALTKLARLGAMALSDLLCEGDVLGVSWGGTVQRAADEIPRREVKRLSVCQLVGSMTSDALLASEASTIRIATRTGAKCNTLPVPAVLSSVELAQALRHEPIVQKHVAQFANLTKLFFSVGDLQDDSMVYASRMVSTAEWKSYKKRGAQAVLVGRFLNAAGELLDGDFHQRLMAIELAQFREVPMRMLVVGGAAKLDAAMATLSGKYATHLVVDDTLAQLL